MLELKNDEGFNALKYPISEGEYDSLEENLFDNGCHDPIIIWNDIIIDGKKRYDICQKWEIPFCVTRINFSCRHEAVSWICRNQIQRNDLPDVMRKYLIGKYFESKKEVCLYLLELSNPPTKKRGIKYKVADEVGKEVNLVGGTVYKYGLFTKAMDNIVAKNKSLAEKILSGKLRISQKNIMELSRLPQEEVRALSNVLSEKNLDYINLAAMRDELQWYHSAVTATPSKKRKSESHPMLIKEVPAYDPDAEISSLTLTIPSWISSIERTRSLADFPQTTAPAREKLKHELFALHKAVFNIQKLLEELNNNG